MQRAKKREKQREKLGSFGWPGRVGLVASLLSFFLLLVHWSRSQASIYLTAIPEVGEAQGIPLSTLFESPITPTNYTNQLPFSPLPDGDPMIYRTASGQTGVYPDCLKFKFETERVFEPRRVYVLINLHEDRLQTGDKPLDGEMVGQVILEPETDEEPDWSHRLDLFAGQEVRNWLIDASSSKSFIHTTSANTHEAYHGVARGSGIPSVIDIVALEVPGDVRNKPLVAVWVVHANCSTGFQIVNVVVEAVRWRNELQCTPVPESDLGGL